ncbi:uncharacterized protein Tco025E_08934 [Trypanosoma conorhini]|uniref:Uncharacterized protein n=1 Tax=Trypanosoma conorhini TaxID=83891 RepID=A0A3R7K3E5_9TRYP|nr:uncharacterized protein Tco025E_08934 [Trypanosoma conorhini]RNE99756.1 hypothetical protein Tco025E_08934 [Trypanosoma conorhini]
MEKGATRGESALWLTLFPCGCRALRVCVVAGNAAAPLLLLLAGGQPPGVPCAFTPERVAAQNATATRQCHFHREWAMRAPGCPRMRTQRRRCVGMPMMSAIRQKRQQRSCIVPRDSRGLPRGVLVALSA